MSKWRDSDGYWRRDKYPMDWYLGIYQPKESFIMDGLVQDLIQKEVAEIVCPNCEVVGLFESGEECSVCKATGLVSKESEADGNG